MKYENKQPDLFDQAEEIKEATMTQGEKEKQERIERVNAMSKALKHKQYGILHPDRLREDNSTIQQVNNSAI